MTDAEATITELRKRIQELESELEAFRDEEAHEEAICFHEGREAGPPDALLRELFDVRKFREETGLSLEEFSEKFGFNSMRLQDWEDGRSFPDRAVRAYLQAISKIPDAIAEAIAIDWSKTTVWRDDVGQP